MRVRVRVRARVVRDAYACVRSLAEYVSVRLRSHIRLPRVRATLACGSLWCHACVRLALTALATVLARPCAPSSTALARPLCHRLVRSAGATIQAIEQVSGATVRLQKASEVPEGASVRLIEIRGTAKQREACERSIANRCAKLAQDFASTPDDPLAQLHIERRKKVDQLQQLTGCPLLQCARVLEACSGDDEAAFERLLLMAGAPPDPQASGRPHAHTPTRPHAPARHPAAAAHCSSTAMEPTAIATVLAHHPTPCPHI